MSMPRKIRCEVASITDHGGRVYTVDLLPSRRVPAFRPGQFLHLTVDEYDPSSFWPESRVFSIASSPRERDRIRICYAVKGRYTTRMEQQLETGGTVWIKLPYGEFVIDGTCDAVLLAGGTGISAFTAFLEALPPDHPNRVTLVYGARAPSLFLFNDMIQAQCARVPSLDVIYFAEEGVESPCRPGCIALDAQRLQLTAPDGQVYYISGPPAMLKHLGADLDSRGVPTERIRTDAWE